MKSRRTINRILYALMTLLFSFSLAQAEPVTLQLKWKHQFQFAGFYMAKEKGFYRDAGFDVQIREVKSGTPAVAQLLDGSADYAVVDPGVLLARSKGAPIKVLSAIFQHSPLALIVREDSGIMSFADLRGKRIMMVPGLNADIDAALRSAGLTADDYTRQETSFDIRDLVNGNTDAFAGYETDQPYQLKELGIAYRIIHPREQGIDFYGDLLVTTEQNIADHPDRVQAFAEASVRGWEYALGHIDEVIDLIEKRYNSQNLTRKQLKFEALKTREMIESDVVQIGYMRAQRWRDIANIYIKQGLLPKNFDSSKAIYQPEPGFITALIKHRGQFGILFFFMLSLLLAVLVTTLRRAIRLRTRSLQESEQRFRDVSEAAGEYLWEIDNHMVYTYVSERSIDVKGYTPEELLGHTPMEFMPDEDIEPTARIVNEAIAAKSSFKLQHRDITKSGAVHWEEVNGTPFYDSDGNVIGLRGAGLNITERKQAEEEKQKILTLINQANDLAYICDVDGNILYTNAIFEELTGHKVEEYTGKPFAPLFDEGNLAIAMDNFSRTLQGESPVYELMFKETGIVCEYKNLPNRDGDGNIIGVLGTARNVTERKKADELINKLSQAIEQAGESILITDKHAIIEYVNPAFAVMSGYSAEEVIGQTPAMLKSGKQDGKLYQQMWTAIESGRVWQGKVIDRKKDGSFFPVMLTISPIRNRDGVTTHYVGIQQDLSDFENLEQQFQQAQKMEAIGTLVGGIAHDFNNILAGITGNLYLAKQRVQAQPEVVHNLDSVEVLSFRAADLIRQLLTFARKDIVDVKPLPFTPFIKEALKFLRTSLPENIRMDQQISSDVLMINGDATQLHQVLMNLVNNARDAVEGVDVPLITVSLQRFEPDDLFLEKHDYFNHHAYAQICVKDNGCGIPDDQLEHLFEPFFTTKPQGKGTGLGLAMVFGAIKTHKGFVEVESCVGKGSRFYIYLPLSELHPEPDLIGSEYGVCDGSGETILLADDEIHIIETGRDVLESLGYKVLTAFNGVQAYEIFEKHRDAIDLCIFDLVMPKMGGYEAAEKIRQMEPQARIIFATGYDKSNQVVMEHETVVSKPFTVVKISQLIRQQLGS